MDFPDVCPMAQNVRLPLRIGVFVNGGDIDEERAAGVYPFVEPLGGRRGGLSRWRPREPRRERSPEARHGWGWLDERGSESPPRQIPDRERDPDDSRPEQILRQTPDRERRLGDSRPDPAARQGPHGHRELDISPVQRDFPDGAAAACRLILLQYGR